MIILTSNLGYGKLAEKYGLRNAIVTRNMVKWYKEKYSDTNNSSVEQSVTSPVDKSAKQADLQIAALQMLIENASKELGIDLVKKFGSKQSKK